MISSTPTIAKDVHSQAEDEYLFGWDATPGIVSVWANREGLALVWRREGERVTCSREQFRPWLFATTLADLTHLGATLRPVTMPGGDKALVSYRELKGPAGSYRYLLSARDGRMLERALLMGPSPPSAHKISSLNEAPDTYYRVGPVQQYLMSSGRVYFRGLSYDELHRLQMDLETTALDPHRGRIFMVAIRDSRGLATTLDAPRPQ